MNASEAHIVVHQDPTTQQVFPLTEKTITVGREAYNDVVLIDPEASRKHAQISFQDGRYVIEDLGSTNGTYVNGRQILSPTALNPGDVIEVGEMARILFQGPGSDISETVLRAPSSSRDATVAMPEDLATFSESLQPPPPTSIPAQAPLPTPAPAPQSQMAMPQQVASKGRGINRRYLGIFGCLIVLLVIACAASFFLLDALAPETLYCGPGQSIFEIFFNDLACG